VFGNLLTYLTATENVWSTNRSIELLDLQEKISFHSFCHADQKIVFDDEEEKQELSQPLTSSFGTERGRGVLIKGKNLKT
jgi:hypothetical protein